MSIQDRDWYREEIANRMRQSNPSSNRPPLRPRAKTVLRPRIVATVVASIVTLSGSYAFTMRLRHSDIEPHPPQALHLATAPAPHVVAIAPPLHVSKGTPSAVATRRPTEPTTDLSRLCSSQAQAAMDSGASPETLRGDWLQRCRLYIADLPADVRLWTLRDPADF